MVLKVGFLVVFLLLFQSLEAKKKKQEPAITKGISTYVESVGDFLKDAWSGFLDLMPTTKKTIKKKKTVKKDKIVAEVSNTITDTILKKDKKKKRRRAPKKSTWSLDSIMKSAKKNLNSLYNSVTGMFQLKTSKRSIGGTGETDLSLEDALNNILSEVISEFSKEHEIQEFKDS